MENSKSSTSIKEALEQDDAKAKKRFLAWIVAAKRGYSSPCWIYAGYTGDGYGRFKLDGKPQLAHRVSYVIHVGEIPDGLQLDHLCRVRSCVNPNHLEPVTLAENISRGFEATKTECVNGHEFTPENTYRRPPSPHQGKRACRTCRREAVARYKARQKGQL